LALEGKGKSKNRSGIPAPPVRYNIRMSRIKHVWIAALLLVPAAALAQNATTPGAVTTPYPTLINLSVEWAITGDDDNDGVVTVRFRQTGAAGWRDALPLRRVPAGSTEGFSWDNKHSGSILDLQPDTEYEIELSLADPDGGSDTRTVTARTRPVPRAAAPTGATATAAAGSSTARTASRTAISISTASVPSAPGRSRAGSEATVSQAWPRCAPTPPRPTRWS
jgi:hypothetical protein